MPAIPESFGPNHRDLYVLAAGIVLGILLGPVGLGRWRPDIYVEHFLSVRQAQENLTQHDADVRAVQEQLLQKLTASGATDVASSELAEKFAAKRVPFVEQLENAKHTQAAMLALVIAAAVVMVIETLPAPEALATRARMATARYALLSLWLALLIAQPEYLGGLSIAFLGALIVLALAVAFVPLGRAKEPVS